MSEKDSPEEPVSKKNKNNIKKSKPGKVKSNQVENDNNLFDILENIEDVPPDKRKSVTMGLMQASLSSRIGHPLFDKFTPEHIDKFLDYSQRDDDNIYKYKSSNRWFVLGYSLIGTALFIFLIVFLLPQNKDLLLDIFKLFVVFAGGFGSGYGIKAWRRK